MTGAQRREAELKALDDALASEIDGGGAYDVLGDPPLDDPATGLAYVRKAQLVAFGQICRSRSLPTLIKWRLIREFGAVLGMTHNRAEIERRTKDLEKKLRDKQAGGAVKEVARVARPATARGVDLPDEFLELDTE